MVKADQALLDRYADLTDVVPDAREKLVFGCPCRLVGGHMFFGVHASGLFVRLPEDAAAEATAVGAEPFEPMAGRPMGGFYVLTEKVPDQEAWVRRAYAYACALPEKKPRRRAATTT